MLALGFLALGQVIQGTACHALKMNNV